MKVKLKSRKGITLIALVITIIVLLILAGVTIATLTGKNGILTRASDAKEETIIAQEKEQIALAQSSSILENGQNFTTSEFRNELKNIAGKDKVTVTNAKDKEGEDVIKIHYKDTDHYYHIKHDQIIKLDDTYYAKKDITEVWAIYYPNGANSELVFNTTGNIDNTKTTTGEIEKWEVSRTNYESTSPPWYSNAANITTVTFEEEVVPEYTAKWFDSFTNLTVENIKNIENLNTSQVISMQRMFRRCQSLVSLNLSSFDTSSVTNMNMMFMSCSGLTSLDLSSFDTSSVTSMSMMFMSCSGLTSLDLSSFDTSSVTSMSMMFMSCSGLTSLDLSSFDTNNVTLMGSMFLGCTALTNLDLSSFGTNNLTSVASMFSSCTSLTNVDLSNFDTRNVTNMSRMFDGCSSLTGLDLSNFDTKNVTNMSYMFFDCQSLTEVKVGENWTTADENTSMFGGSCGVSDVTYSTGT